MSLALPLDSSQRGRTSACWAFSMSIHGLLIGMAVVLLAEMPPPPPPTFKWNVAVVQPPAPVPEPAPAPPVESQPPPTPQPVTPSKPKQVPLAKAEPVVRQVQTVQERQPVQQLQPVQESVPVQTAQAVQHVTAQRVEAITPTVQETVSPTPEVVQTFVESTAAVEEATPMVQHVSAPPVVASAEPVTETAAVESVPAPLDEPQQVRQEVIQRSVQTVQHRVVKHRAVQARPEAQADFGWLGQEIWSSVDQRKRYPPEAKRNRWEGRVILRLTIEQQGAAVHLLELSLEKSSGHSVLDRHTLDMVRNAFPLKVKHQMAQSKVQLDVPFSYHME
ncbi:MAG TPA: TonB family protein [Nitrospira sp.]|nr:energy transducer TonB [Nitrospira sp. NTP1]HQR15713.1 TonB family protein [Nitrospira sp.]